MIARIVWMMFLALCIGSSVVSAQAPPVAGYEGGAGGGERVEGVGMDADRFYFSFGPVVAVSKGTKPAGIEGFVELTSQTGRGKDWVLKFEQNQRFFAGKSVCAYPTGASWPEGKTQLNELTPSNASGCAPIDNTGHIGSFPFKISSKQKGARHVQCMSLVLSDGAKGVFWGGNGQNSLALTVDNSPTTCFVVDPTTGRIETLEQVRQRNPGEADAILTLVAKLK